MGIQGTFIVHLYILRGKIRDFCILLSSNSVILLCFFIWMWLLLEKKGSQSRKDLEGGISRLAGKKLGVIIFLSLWDIIIIWILNWCKLTWLYLRWQNHLLYPHLCVTFNSLNISCSFFIAFSENYCKQRSAHILQCFSTPFISIQSRLTLKCVIHYWY